MHRSFNSDRESVISDARFEGVSPLIMTGTSEHSSIEAARYASKYPGLLEPKYLVHILDEIAYYLGKDAEDLADETYNTTCRFFGIR